MCRGCRIVIKCVKGSCTVKVCRNCSRRDVEELLARELLPLPEPSNANGIILGVDEYGNPVTIPVELMWRHVGIFGATGSGKTSTAIKLVKELWLNNVPVIVVDWNGEYVEPLEKYGVDVGVYNGASLPRLPLIYEAVPLEATVDTLKHVLGLSEHQASLLLMILSLIEGVTPLAAMRLFNRDLNPHLLSELEELVIRARSGNTILDLLELIDALWYIVSSRDILAKSRSEAEIWAALLRRLERLVFSRDSRLIVLRGNGLGELVKNSSQKVIVFDVSTIHDPRVKRIYSALLVGSLYDSVKAGKMRVVAIVEEAHNIVEQAYSLIAYVLAEARKHGLGLVLVSSRLDVFANLAHNINTLIMHRSMASKNTVAKLNPILDHEELARLNIGEALLATPLTPTPVKVLVRCEFATENRSSTHG